LQVIGPFNAQTIINEAAELLGIVSPSGMENSDDLQSCLRSLNLMLSAWSADQISARAYVTETFTIIANKRQYQWGLGAPDFNSQRPMQVITCNLQYTQFGNLLVPMEVIGSDHYQAFGDSLIVIGPPNFVWPDPQMPNMLMNFYPIPDQGYNVVITSVQDLAGMTSLSTDFSIDPIYYEPMVYNLAIYIAPKFGKNPSKLILDRARTSYQTLGKVVSPDMYYSSDFPLTRAGTNAPILDGGYNN
jgi:hypothetical protein